MAYFHNKTDRQQEIQDAFAIWDNKALELKNKTILLFDDIITSGNTILSIHKALQPYQLKQVYTLAFCRPEQH